MKIELWAGTQESYDVVLQAQVSLSKMAASMQASGMYDMPDTPPTWKKDGSLATVNVHGSLIQGHAGFLSHFGVSGYSDISQALVEAASDPEVKSIMLDVNSPGGSVNGAQEAADLISQISSVKPVSAHVEQLGASAGYWLASAAPHVSVNPTAQVGSIGVLNVHTSYHKQLADAGVDKTIIRSGANKAGGNSIEPLSESAREDMQSKVNDIAHIFLSHVQAKRGGKLADPKAGDGLTFLGKRAVTAGLADKVSTYQQAVDYAKKVDKAKLVPQNAGKS